MELLLAFGLTAQWKTLLYFTVLVGKEETRGSEQRILCKELNEQMPTFKRKLYVITSRGSGGLQGCRTMAGKEAGVIRAQKLGGGGGATGRTIGTDTAWLS